MERPNRFLALVGMGADRLACFVPNPGRMEELLLPRRAVILREAKVGQKGRKTSYDLVGVRLRGGIVSIEGRFDFLLKGDGERCLLEVKSCTLVRNRKALFPDAKTERGRRHLEALTRAKGEGYRAAVIFAIQRIDAEFSPQMTRSILSLERPLGRPFLWASRSTPTRQGSMALGFRWGEGSRLGSDQNRLGG